MCICTDKHIFINILILQELRFPMTKIRICPYRMEKDIVT